VTSCWIVIAQAIEYGSTGQRERLPEVDQELGSCQIGLIGERSGEEADREYQPVLQRSGLPEVSRVQATKSQVGAIKSPR